MLLTWLRPFLALFPSDMDVIPQLHFQFQADSSSTLPCPLNVKACPPEPESDGSDGIESAGIFVHESTQVKKSKVKRNCSKKRNSNFFA